MAGRHPSETPIGNARARHASTAFNVSRLPARSLSLYSRDALTIRSRDVRHSQRTLARSHNATRPRTHRDHRTLSRTRHIQSKPQFVHVPLASATPSSRCITSTYETPALWQPSRHTLLLPFEFDHCGTPRNCCHIPSLNPMQYASQPCRHTRANPPRHENLVVPTLFEHFPLVSRTRRGTCSQRSRVRYRVRYFTTRLAS